MLSESEGATMALPKNSQTAWLYTQTKEWNVKRDQKGERQMKHAPQNTVRIRLGQSRAKGKLAAQFLPAMLGIALLILASGTSAASGFLLPSMLATNSGGLAQGPMKNPKLSTQIANLARGVAQRGTPLAPGERLTAPPGFSIAKLPKSARDAIKAGLMKVSDKGEVQVYIEVNQITPVNLSQLQSSGVTIQILGEPKPDKKKGEVLSAVPTVQGLLPMEMINQVAALPFVRYIRLPDYGFTNTGSVTSQGDAILQAQAVRNQFGVDGTGIKIGVISDGIGGVFATSCTTCGPTTATPSPISSGDLPSATGTRNSSGVLTVVSGGIIAESFPSSAPNLEPPSTDTASGVAAEGTAMLEIVHDLAPGAQLYFANAADGTSMSFEQAVDWLASNVDVGVDDISFQIPPFDGTSAVSTNTATDLNMDTNPIRGYFTAVGNMRLDHWEELWSDSGVNFNFSSGNCSQPLGNGDVQLFQATPNTNDLRGFGPSLDNVLEVPSGVTVTVFLTWNDFSGSISDYALYLNALSSDAPDPPSNPLSNFGSCVAYDPTPTVITNPQTGTNAPLDKVSWTNTTGAMQPVGIYIQNVANQQQARTFDMFVNGVVNQPQDLNFDTFAGSVPAESDAGGSPVSVVSVGATDAQMDAQGNPPATVTEPYSGEGPTESTPQASPGRMKPDVTGTDGVSVTGAGGFGFGDSLGMTPCPLGNPSPPGCFFFGTSAAAPHVAAVAALVLQSAPCLLSSSTANAPATARTNLRNLITNTAVTLPYVYQEVPNNIEGFGLVNALAAVSGTLPTAYAGGSQIISATSASGASVSLSGSGTDPDKCPLKLSWSGSCGTASGASAIMTCPIGNDTETLTVSNGGARASLPTSKVQITVSDFAVSVAQATASVSPGQTASYTVTVGSQFGTFSNPVLLACSGLPSLASCTLSPSSVTPGSGSTTSTLSIMTTAASFTLPMFLPQGHNRQFFILWLGLFLIFAVATIFAKRSRRKFGFGLALSAMLICLGTLIVACGGGGGAGGGPKNPGTPAGTYTVTVTGTSSQLQHSTKVSLTVQ